MEVKLRRFFIVQESQNHKRQIDPSENSINKNRQHIQERTVPH